MIVCIDRTQNINVLFDMLVPIELCFDRERTITVMVDWA